MRTEFIAQIDSDGWSSSVDCDAKNGPAPGKRIENFRPCWTSNVKALSYKFLRERRRMYPA
jgi:hypothetical protein